MGPTAALQIGTRSSIGFGTYINTANGGGLDDSQLVVGAETYIGEYNNLRCAGAPIRIGDKCLISQFVTLIGTNHGIRVGTPVVDQPWEGLGIRIGNGVWIGAGCTVLPGSNIGDGAIIAAGSVVRGSVRANCILGGVPGRELGVRRDT